jgi:WD40 repeat protein
MPHHLLLKFSITAVRYFFLACFIFIVGVQYPHAQDLKLLLPVVSNDAIDKAFISPDKQLLIASTFSTQGVSEIKVWNVRNRKLLYTLRNNYIVNNSVYLSGDGKALLSSDEKQLNVWSTIDGEPLFHIVQKEPFDFASFTHDGKEIITTCNDSIKVWDAANGHFIYAIGGGNKTMYPAILSADDKLLATCYRGSINLWDIKATKLLSTFRAAADRHGKYLEENRARQLRFSADGQYLFAHYFDSTLYIRNVRQPENSVTVPKVSGFAVSDNGKIYAMLTGNKITVSSLPNNRVIFEKVSDWYASIELSASGEYLLATLLDKADYMYYTSIYKVGKDELLDRVSTNLPFKFKPVITNCDSVLIYTKTLGNKDVLYTNTLKQGKHAGPPVAYTWQSKNISRFNLTGKPGIVVTSYGDSVLRLWNIKDIKPVNGIKISNGWPAAMNAAIFVDVIKGGEQTYPLMDTLLVKELLSGKLLKKIPSSTKGEMFVNATGKLLVADRGIMDDKLDVIDLEQGKVIKTIAKPNGNPVTAVSFVPNSTKIVSSNNTLAYEWQVYDLATGKFDFTLKNRKDDSFTDADVIFNYSFSPDGKYAATVSSNRLLIWNLGLKKVIREIMEPAAFSASAFSGDGKYFIYGLKNGEIVITTVSGSPVKRLAYHTSAIYKLIVNNASQQLISAEINGKTVLTDLKTFTAVQSITTDLGNSLLDVDFSNSKAYFSDGAMLSVYDMPTGKKTVSFAGLNQNAYVYLSAQNYYAATPFAAANLAWKNGNDILSFEQMDVKYNRPDKVLEAVGSTDTALISSYRKAYEKRLRKLGINTAAPTQDNAVPMADFKNRDQIGYEQKQQQLSLRITAKDNATPIDHFNVWVNESPVYGMRGLRLHKAKGQVLDTTVTITLSDGDNRIETSVTNAGGIESYKVPLYVKYEPAKSAPGKLYFIGIGINHFAESGHDLSWSVKDIQDMAIKLKEKYGDNCVIRTLFDQDVSVEKVAALKAELLQTNVNDKVIIAYSGHGLLSKSYDYYLSAYKVNFSKPQEDGLPYEALEDLLNGIPARKKLMLIDACHSGEVDKEEMTHYQESEDALSKKGITKGVKLVRADGNRIGMKNSFELMQELFANVGRSTGATIISAAGGTQYALENGSLKNGVFTYSILEYMQQHPHASVSALKLQVNKRVTELTNGMQVPTTRNETNTVDWEVW